MLRACRELGIETVAAYSQADAEALHVQLATQAVCIGPARAADSYLNPQDAMLTAALATGCDGRSSRLRLLVRKSRTLPTPAPRAASTFIGPSGDAIRKAGHQIRRPGPDAVRPACR